MTVPMSDIAAMVGGFIWPFIRISTMFLAAPVFGSRSVSVRIRIALSFTITLITAPLLTDIPALDLSLSMLLIALQEVLIGVTIGFILHLAFGALTLAGEQVALSMGLGFASMADPQNGSTVPVVSQVLMILGTLMFLSVGAHIIFIELMVESFRHLPIGENNWDVNTWRNIVAWGSRLFVGAVLIAIPVGAMTLLMYVALGLMTRAAPQMNIFSVGFPLTMLVGFVALFLCIPGMLRRFQLILFEVLDLTRFVSGG